MHACTCTRVHLLPTHSLTRTHTQVGIDIVLLGGTTDEWASLSVDERIALAQAWRAAVPAGKCLRMASVCPFVHGHPVSSVLTHQPPLSIPLVSIP